MSVTLSLRGKSSGGTIERVVSGGAPTAAPKASVEAAAAKEAASDATSASAEGVPIGMTSIAMILAIGTVSAGAALAENATASLVPKFDPKLQRFDQSTFSGRLSKMLLACDPFLLTYSSEEVKKCKAMVDDYEHHLRNLPAGVSETEMSRKLWEAQVNKIRLIENQPMTFLFPHTDPTLHNLCIHDSVLHLRLFTPTLVILYHILFACLDTSRSMDQFAWQW